MRLVVQRVTRASVSVGDDVISSIGRGLCVLVGINDTDTQDDINWCANKLLKFRLFDDDSGKRWAKGVQDKDLEVLCVSQFTLYYQMKGNKPDYRHAMSGDRAKEFYQNFLEKLKTDYHVDKVKDGVFGAMMQVEIINDGPVTINIDSPDRKTNHKNTEETNTPGVSNLEG